MQSKRERPPNGGELDSKMSKRKTNRSPPSCPSKISKRGPEKSSGGERGKRQPHLVLLGPGEDVLKLRPVLYVDVLNLGGRGRPSVSGGDKDLLHQVRLGELPREGVLSTSSAKQEDSLECERKEEGNVRTRSSRRDRRWAEIRETLGSSPVGPARKGKSKPKVSYGCSYEYTSP